MQQLYDMARGQKDSCASSSHQDAIHTGLGPDFVVFVRQFWNFQTQFPSMQKNLTGSKDKHINRSLHPILDYLSLNNDFTSPLVSSFFPS